MFLTKLVKMTTARQIIDGLDEMSEQDGIAKENRSAYGLGYLASYVARLNQAQQEAGKDDVRPLTDAEVDKLLVNVLIAKLEKMLAERRNQCHFPGCTAPQHNYSMFGEDHESHECENCGDEFLEREHLLEHWRETSCGETIGNARE